jgi:hypothetical protein
VIQTEEEKCDEWWKLEVHNNREVLGHFRSSEILSVSHFSKAM